MRALLLLPLQRLILSIRLRITEHIFARENTRSKSPFRISLIIGSLCALGLFVYSIAIDGMGLVQLDYTNTNLYPSLITLGGLVVVIAGVVLLNYSINEIWSSAKAKQSSGLLRKESLLRVILIVVAYIALGYIGVAPIVIYYLLVAGSEEGLKRLSSITLFKKHSFTASDLILFALLVSLGFAFLENIIYMIQRTESLHTIGQQLTVGSGVLITRGIVGFVVHMLFTGIIAYGSLQGIQKRSSIRLLLALLAGIGLHMSYNIFMYYNIGIVVGFYLLAGYFMLSWLFYKSDGVYLSN